MTKPPSLRIGEMYTATSGASIVWRVERFLADGVHVVLVADDEPTRRKTVSAGVLAESRHFVRTAR